ncbi:MAG: RNA polymerase sigma-70 factor (ECF subfamily) [Pseudoalteromonas tetraodonis]|jgi:RNA polymerase sigma-70 factor (ECF subfamily)
MNRDSKEFILLMTEAQSSIYAYVLSIFPDRSRARDILQETNLTMWKKAEQFTEGTEFTAWGCKIAYFHVLSARRKFARDRHIFDDSLLDYLAERQDSRIDELPSRHIALRRCLEKLPKPQRDLVKARYAPEGSVKDIASKMGRSVGSISQTLYRARNALLDCIEKSMRSDPEQTL